MIPTISTQELSFSYGNDVVLRDVNVSFPKGKLSIILGRNGSGKSTLFNVIAGLEKRYDGQIFIGDVERKKIKVGNSSELRLGFQIGRASCRERV